MKKLILILSLCCSLALAENSASTPINQSPPNNSNAQPKLIMVKGVTSNQTSSTPPQKHAAHSKKTSSHNKQTKQHKSAKNEKHNKTTTKKTQHTSHAKKATKTTTANSK